MVDSNFINNTITPGTNIGGGAIGSTGNNSLIHNNTFFNNKGGDMGGAINMGGC
ncbi:hypothetical protein ALNOE001_16300 [Candidatus Methanobinarius endosymbioticus]|uniref:Uncharacterized protein n=1 Tax=Candidatus Methanobinarius endosymbioticus TaxID=2006182 RepID=A0A366MA17_9EURY|nr:hypothetical protein ALNOE001_16300 [Candidatus Methanobinarius endosymbioticus]